jgi:hypothetical protein
MNALPAMPATEAVAVKTSMVGPQAALRHVGMVTVTPVVTMMLCVHAGGDPEQQDGLTRVKGHPSRWWTGEHGRMPQGTQAGCSQLCIQQQLRLPVSECSSGGYTAITTSCCTA